jgi:Dolichyl-phosphate-mannose-protein mannosyltransferase
MPASRSIPIVGWIAANPGRAFAAFIGLHVAVWTALPALLYPNLPLDLIEALVYGREWQLGYDKLPPLPWWLVQITYQLVGHDFAYYLLAQVTVAAAFAIVWTAARPLVGALGALVAVLIVDGLHYVNFTAAKFNHDVIQLPFWALAGLSFHRALRHRQMADWLLLGVAIGLSLWAKYFVVVLAAPLALFVLFDRDARKVLATPGPYVAAAVALVVMAPHLIWLVQNDFLPFAYAEHRATLPRGPLDHIWHPLQFAGYQLIALAPSLLIALPLFLPRKHTGAPAVSKADTFDMRIVTLLAFGPLATLLALCAVTGRGTIAMWGCPLWLFFGLWLVLVAQRRLDNKRLVPIAIIWAASSAAMAVGFIGDYGILPFHDHRYRAVFFPGAELGREISQRYSAATGKPLDYVIGGMWVGGNVAHYAPSHPRLLVDGKPSRSPWIDLNDLRAKGAVVVFWTDGDRNTLPAEYKTIAEGAVVQPPIDVHYLRADLRGDPLVHIGWAILKAQR